MPFSNNPFESVRGMVTEFGLDQVRPNKVILGYRMDLLKEEMKETEEALDSRDAESLVDGHVDLVFVALGNLAIMRVDIDKAFNEVMEANMRKVIGGRKSTDPIGASIAKPLGWRGPNHGDNHGELDVIFG